MKKFIVAIAAFLYLSTSCGATVYLHYCMGKLVSVGLLPQKDPHCTICGMKKAANGKGCCKDEHKLVKLDKDQKATDRSELSHPYKIFSTLYLPFTACVSPKIPSITEASPVSNAPPRSRLLPVYLLQRRLLI